MNIEVARILDMYAFKVVGSFLHGRVKTYLKLQFSKDSDLISPQEMTLEIPAEDLAS